MNAKSNPDVADESAATLLPNFIYIGTSKAGSTWIYRFLAAHPDVYVAPGKGAYYFDQHFDRGVGWYSEQFQRSQGKPAVGEISHSYLSSPESAKRIAALLPSVKLLVCLREPVERAFSAYMDSVKNLRFEGTFDEALDANPSLLERGAYGQHLQRYLALFPREQLHIAIFDDLRSRPQQFANQLCDFLQVECRSLAAADHQRMMPAAEPRSRSISKVVKRLARSADKMGMRGFRGRVKRSRFIRNLLYRPLRENEMPAISMATREKCRDHFRPEIEQVDELLGIGLRERWGY